MTPQGRAVREAIARVLKQSWPEVGGAESVVAACGYGIPYLDELGDGAGVSIALLPAAMGAMHWQGKSAVIDNQHWPLAGASVDVVVLIHALEYAQMPDSVLDEAWRVLKPEGRLLLVVPNRRGPWARFENSPFGYGQPFSKEQIYQLLRARDFTLEGFGGALLAPPLASRTYNAQVMPLVEKLATFATPLCGVVVADARKRLFAPITGKLKLVTPKAAPAWAVG